MTARKGWSTGGKVAAWLVGGAAVLYGAHRILSLPAVEEREVFLMMRTLGIHTQRPGEALPETSAGTTAAAGRQAMLALFPVDIVDRWIRRGFTFWATPERTAAVVRTAADPGVEKLRPDTIAWIRAVQAKLGET